MRTWSAGLLAVAMVLASGAAGAQITTTNALSQARWTASGAGCGTPTLAGGVFTVTATGAGCGVSFASGYFTTSDPNPTDYWTGGFGRSFTITTTGTPWSWADYGYYNVSGGSCDDVPGGGAMCGPNTVGTLHGVSVSMVVPQGTTLSVSGSASFGASAGPMNGPATQLTFTLAAPVTPAPEPTSLALIGTGIVALVPFARRRRV